MPAFREVVLNIAQIIKNPSTYTHYAISTIFSSQYYDIAAEKDLKMRTNCSLSTPKAFKCVVVELSPFTTPQFYHVVRYLVQIKRVLTTKWRHLE